MRLQYQKWGLVKSKVLLTIVFHIQVKAHNMTNINILRKYAFAVYLNYYFIYDGIKVVKK